MTLWTRVLLRLRDILKPLHLQLALYLTASMATKLGRMVTNVEGLLPIIFLSPLVTWSYEITGQTKTIKSPQSPCLLHQTWQECGLPWGSPTHKVIWSFNHVFLRDHVTNLNYYISTITVSMATNLDRLGVYNVELPCIKSQKQGSLTTWSCKVTLNISSVISLPTQSLWPPKLGRWRLIMRSFTHKVTQAFEHVVTWGHVIK